MTTTATSNSSQTSAGSEIEVKANGSLVASKATPVVFAEIETSLRMPGMATIAFADDQHALARDTKFALGTEIEISFTGVGQRGSERTLAFKGVVAALEARREALRGVTVVRSYDALSKLYGPRRTRTFVTQKYGDIVGQVVRGVGLEVGTIDEGGPVHDLVLQYDESDGEFLERLAAEYGWIFGLDDGWKFSFGRAPDLAGAPAAGSFARSGPEQLLFGDDLVSYEVSHGPTPPVHQVRATWWDVQQKRAEPVPAPISEGRKFVELANMSELRPPNGDFAITSIPFTSRAAAEQAAKGMADQIAASAGSLRGRIPTGNAAVRAGRAVSVGPSDHAFAGKYLITSARHEYEGGRLRTEIVCDGLGDRGLAAGGHRPQTSAAALPNNFPWVTTGIVTDVSDHGRGVDKRALGRVKVKLPSIGLDGQGTTDWLRVVGLGNGPKRGTWWLPEVNDEVVVVFERGDLRVGYVLGGVHNGTATPEFGSTATEGGKPVKRGFTTTSGHKLMFTDKAGEETIELETAGTVVKMTFDKQNKLASIDVDGGQALVKLDAMNGITIEAQKQITIESKSGDIAMKAMNVKIEAQSNVELKATGNVDVKATGQATVEGTAGATLKGSGPVEVSSSAITAVKGSLVQIN